MMAPLIIISGPSGSGKTTVVAELMKTSRLPLRRAITATTREPRDGEVDERDYHFWTPERFQKEIAAGGLLEWALVHERDYYGTPRSEVDPFRQDGVGVLLVIDVQGAALVRQRYPESFSIFLRVPEDCYEDRLRDRGDKEASISRRMVSAKQELERAGEYNAQLLNDRLPDTVSQLEQLIARQFPGA
jgi:guanylate kinase